MTEESWVHDEEEDRLLSDKCKILLKILWYFVFSNIMLTSWLLYILVMDNYIIKTLFIDDHCYIQIILSFKILYQLCWTSILFIYQPCHHYFVSMVNLPLINVGSVPISTKTNYTILILTRMCQIIFYDANVFLCCLN